MERQAAALGKRSSLTVSMAVAAGIATALLLSIYLRSAACSIPSPLPRRFPESTCSPALRRRPATTLSTKNRRLWSTSAWISSVESFSLIFAPLPTSILSNSSKSLSLLAGAGQEVMALHQIGVRDVTALDLVDSPPLVARADLYNLPFFDAVFDFAFSAQFDTVLFPAKFVSEMERTVRVGGHCLVLVHGETTLSEAEEIANLFRTGTMVGNTVDVVLNGSRMKRILLKITNSTSLSF